MDAPPPTDPTWVDFFKYTLIAFITSIAVGRPWADPKTGEFSGQQLTQAVAAAIIFGVGTAGAQERFNQPFWITGTFAAFLAIVGMPAIVATAQSFWRVLAKLKLGVDDGAK